MSPFIVAGATFLIVGLVVVGFLAVFYSRKSVVEIRLEELKQSGAEDMHAAGGKAQPLLERLARFAGTRAPMSEKMKGRYRTMLTHAGFRKGNALPVFVGSKVIAGAAGALLVYPFALAQTHKPGSSLALAALAAMTLYLVPNVWLNEKIKKRKIQIFHSLPDVLDLLTVCVEAGLGLDAAIIKITEEFRNNVLALEFRLVSGEIRAGKPRIEALRDMGERTGVEDIKSLAALLIQTEKLGASLSRALRVHSDSLRTKRRQIAEEAAAKTTIKLVFPLAFFIFPALMIVILGPAMIKIYSTLFKVMHG